MSKQKLTRDRLRRIIGEEKRRLDEAAMTTDGGLIEVRPGRYDDDNIQLKTPKGTFKLEPKQAENLIKSLRERI